MAQTKALREEGGQEAAPSARSAVTPTLRIQWLRLVCICSAIQAVVCAGLAVWRGQAAPASAVLLMLPFFIALDRKADRWSANKWLARVLLLAALAYPAALQWAFGGFERDLLVVTMTLFVPMAAPLATQGARASRRWRLLYTLLLAAGAAAEYFLISAPVGMQAAVMYGALLLLGWLLSLGLEQVRTQADAATFRAQTLADELQDTQEDLGTAGRVKNDFLASMSHEIRTPMHAISGMADMLLLSEQLGPTEYMQAENIKLASQNLIGLINDILDISKIEAGKLELYEERYDFPSMFHDVVSIINLRARERGLTFLTQVDPEIPKEMVGDSVRIRQVLLNLLGNAVKFTEKGSVTLRVQRVYRDSQLMLRFEVADTGVGIPPEELSKLFAPFEQLNSTKAQNRQGTGLGLAISRRLMELMHSELSVRSKPGVGTAFEFTIAQQVVNDAPIASVPGARDKRLLICSDQPALYENAIEMAARLKVKAERGTPAQAASYTHMLLDLSAEAAYAWIRQPTPQNCQRALLVDPATSLTAYIRMSDRVIFHPLHVMTMSAVLNDAVTDKAPTPIQQARECLFQTRDARVLLIDDNEVNLMVAANLLKLYGIEVEQAISGEQGISKLKLNDFDIVFVDHIMPGMDGVDTVRAIRAMGGRFATQVLLMLSANVMPESRKLFIKAGAQDMLAKPVELPKLSQLLRTYLPPEKCLSKQNLPAGSGFLQARLQQIVQALAPLELSRTERLLENERIDEVDAYLMELQDALVELEPLLRRISACVSKFSRQWTLRAPLRKLGVLLERIGERRLAAHTGMLRLSLDQGDSAFVRENLRSLSQKLERFYARLRTALQECDATVVSKSEDVRLLEQIREMLLTYQYADALDLFAALRAVCTQAERARVEQLNTHLQAFEYRSALEIVEGMLEERMEAEAPPPSEHEPMPSLPRRLRRVDAQKIEDAVIEAARDTREVVAPRPMMDDDDFSDEEIPPEFAAEFDAEMNAILAARAARKE